MEPDSEKFLRDARDEKRREALHEVQAFPGHDAAPAPEPDETMPETPADAGSFDHEGATD